MLTGACALEHDITSGPTEDTSARASGQPKDRCNSKWSVSDLVL
jgi:hypothetical protein